MLNLLVKKILRVLPSKLAGEESWLALFSQLLRVLGVVLLNFGNRDLKYYHKSIRREMAVLLNEMVSVFEAINLLRI